MLLVLLDRFGGFVGEDGKRVQMVLRHRVGATLSCSGLRWSCLFASWVELDALRDGSSLDDFLLVTVFQPATDKFTRRLLLCRLFFSNSAGSIASGLLLLLLNLLRCCSGFFSRCRLQLHVSTQWRQRQSTAQLLFTRCHRRSLC